MKKVDIELSEPINRVAEIDEVCAAFEKRGGYITLVLWSFPSKLAHRD